MALTKFTEDVNNVQNLPDKPTETSDELKQKFDKAGNDIKEYINDVLVKEIDELIKELQLKKIGIDKIINDIETGGANNVASAELVKGISESINKTIDNIKKDKLDKTGGTLTGDLVMNLCKILFSNDGNIEWKENGYGDKFRIRADFNGSEDANILKIQATTGGVGENPTNWKDLFHISAKSGNIALTGTMTAYGGLRGDWHGYINDMHTENTSDTWLLVMNSSKIQHRTIHNIIQSYLKSGATTQITSGSSNPSGGNNGDVYIQYF